LVPPWWQTFPDVVVDIVQACSRQSLTSIEYLTRIVQAFNLPSNILPFVHALA
jgi:hypothetical protein